MKNYLITNIQWGEDEDFETEGLPRTVIVFNVPDNRKITKDNIEDVLYDNFHMTAEKFTFKKMTDKVDACISW